MYSTQRPYGSNPTGPRHSPLAAAALALAATHAMPVFPCRPRSKMPLVGPLLADGRAWIRGVHTPDECAVRGGFHRATTDAAQIRAWWAQWPDANIGVRLGTDTRLCLLEADNAEADAWLATLASSWPATWTYRASRGVNRLFRAPANMPERPIRHLWPETHGRGIEFKSGLGLFVAPPSVHPSGHLYAWEPDHSPDDLPLAELPAIVTDEVHRLDAERLHGPRAPHPREYDTSFDPVRTLDALRYLDADDYETWRDVGLALKHSGHPAGRGVWDTWSAASDKYNPTTQQQQWDSMRPTQITLASIFFHAKQAGWSPRRVA